MKALSGKPEECSKDGPRVATRRGLPLIIPGDLRLRMEAKDPDIIRLVLSMLTVYRVLKTKAITKINTITDKFSGLCDNLPVAEVEFVLQHWFNIPDVIPTSWWIYRMKGWKLLHGNGLLPLNSVGPNNRISLRGAMMDAIAFQKYPQLLENLKTIAKSTNSRLIELLDSEIKFIPRFMELCFQKSQEVFNPEDKILGVLHEKIEPAGKVRIFAICDIWTQSALKPLHDYIGHILKVIPQDGTFNQAAPLKLLLEQNHKQCYSFDLTAATDRLPVSLQVTVLSFLLGKDFAEAWRSLLTDREYWLNGVPYKYAVGQPMGAYSSWVMLALTHHLIVQVAARRAGHKTWFKHYALLGDDIVIADTNVAQVYLTLMSDLGVGINKSKSLESDSGVMEFAKRLVSPEFEMSPIGPKNVLQAIYNLKHLPRVFLDLFNKGWQTNADSVRDILNSYPKGCKSLKGNELGILWSIIGPMGFVDGGLSPYIKENNSLSINDLRVILKAFDNVLNRILVSNYYSAEEQNQKLWDWLHGVKRSMISEGPFLIARRWEPNYVSFSSKTKWEDVSEYHRLPYESLPSWKFISNELSKKILNKEGWFEVSDAVRREFDQDSEITLETVSSFISEKLGLLDDMSISNPFQSMALTDTTKLSDRLKIYKMVRGEIYSIDPAVAVGLWPQESDGHSSKPVS